MASWRRLAPTGRRSYRAQCLDSVRRLCARRGSGAPRSSRFLGQALGSCVPIRCDRVSQLLRSHEGDRCSRAAGGHSGVSHCRRPTRQGPAWIANSNSMRPPERRRSGRRTQRTPLCSSHTKSPWRARISPPQRRSGPPANHLQQTNQKAAALRPCIRATTSQQLYWKFKYQLAGYSGTPTALLVFHHAHMARSHEVACKTTIV